MMAWMPRLTRKYTPIAVDMGAVKLKAVQLAASGAGWRLHAAAAIPLPVPDHPLDAHVVRNLHELMYRHGFVGRQVVLAAPTKELKVDVLDLPPRSSGAPVGQLARVELARVARIEDEFELACWDLPAPSRGSAATSLMAVALRHKDAEALIEPFAAEGLDVLAIDTRAWALARACGPFDSRDTITAVLDLGFNAITLALIHDGSVIYQCIVADAGLGVLSRAMNEEFQLADDEAEYVLGHLGVADPADTELADMAHAPRIGRLIARHVELIADEIERALQYAIHRHADLSVIGLKLVGGGSSIAGICPMLSARLSIDVRVLRPVDLVQCPGHLLQRCGDGSFTPAVGLAWHGARSR